jgi:hypothetical protein
MKKIELNAEHMAKIFDMCNHYYADTVLAGAIIVEGMVLFKDIKGEFVKIHWMELCFIHLSNKVLFTPTKPKHFAQDTHARLLDNAMKLFNEEDKFIHPVDFLHKEYLKNKK